LFEILYKDYRSIIKKGRSFKKIYTTSTNFVCALNKYEERHFNEVPEVFGKIVENLIYNILSKNFSKVNFWRYHKKEVDFIIKKQKNILPIEVKFRNNIELSDLKNLIYYCQTKKISRAIVITKNVLDKKNIKQINICYIPYYFLLTL